VEADLETPLPRTLTFTDPERIRELAWRGEALGTSEAREMLEQVIDTGQRLGILLRSRSFRTRKTKSSIEPTGLNSSWM
jgi:hypothetical protein